MRARKILSHTHNSPGHAHLSVAARRFCVSAEVRRRFSIINRAKGKLIAASRDKKPDYEVRGFQQVHASLCAT